MNPRMINIHNKLQRVTRLTYFIEPQQVIQSTNL
jgi:hypothetical protein